METIDTTRSTITIGNPIKAHGHHQHSGFAGWSYNGFCGSYSYHLAIERVAYAGAAHRAISGLCSDQLNIKETGLANAI